MKKVLILEDEENIRWMVRQLGAEPLPVPVDEAWGIKGDLTEGGQSLPVYRFLPSHVRGEGFFLAVMRKPVGDAVESEQAFWAESVAGNVEKDKKKQKSNKGKGKDAKGKEAKKVVPSYEQCRQWLAVPEMYEWGVSDDTVSAIPLQWSGAVEQLKSELTVLHAGVAVEAKLHGKAHHGGLGNADQIAKLCSCEIGNLIVFIKYGICYFFLSLGQSGIYGFYSLGNISSHLKLLS